MKLLEEHVKEILFGHARGKHYYSLECGTKLLRGQTAARQERHVYQQELTLEDTKLSKKLQLRRKTGDSHYKWASP